MSDKNVLNQPSDADAKPLYEPPKVLKKRSVAKVTLATGGAAGGGPPGGAITSTGSNPGSIV